MKDEKPEEIIEISSALPSQVKPSQAEATPATIKSPMQTLKVQAIMEDTDQMVSESASPVALPTITHDFVQHELGQMGLPEIQNYELADERPSEIDKFEVICKHGENPEEIFRQSAGIFEINI